ncbi:hypothetical protein XENORESO_015161 [Xenotaenia resolanae]|uniref:Uncharacterized protein n=1 Tax=Xenotaenia resolanae TaxID=208358 RepID=A0ABV0VQX9_9TELE
MQYWHKMHIKMLQLLLDITPPAQHSPEVCLLVFRLLLELDVCTSVPQCLQPGLIYQSKKLKVHFENTSDLNIEINMLDIPTDSELVMCEEQKDATSSDETENYQTIEGLI